jgi:hypothetical protein
MGIENLEFGILNERMGERFFFLQREKKSGFARGLAVKSWDVRY